MLKYELKNQNNIEVTVVPSEDQQTADNEDQTRFLGEIVKGMSEYQFFTTPTEYLHALWWIEDGDLDDLKQKILELNGG